MPPQKLSIIFFSIIFLLGLLSCKDSSLTDKDIYVPHQPLPCYPPIEVNNWQKDSFNSEYSIMYPDTYVKLVNLDPTDFTFGIRRSGVATIGSGFCHPTIDPCFSIEYGDEISLPLPDTIGTFKLRMLVCENDTITAAFYTTTTQFGHIYLKTCNMECMKWAGATTFRQSEEEEVMSILKTLRRF